MSVFKYLRIIFLSFYWQLPKAKEVELTISVEIHKVEKRKVEKRKILKKKREKHPPIQRRVLGHQGFRKTSPKDSRFSNQRKLRRMYRGV